MNRLSPNLPVMAIVFTAALLFGGAIYGILLIMFTENFHMSRSLSLTASTACIFAWLTFAAINIARLPKYWNEHVHSTKLFYWFQAIAMSLIFFGAILTGHGNSQTLKWAGVIFECILAAFYTSYVGFAFCLRYRLPNSAYWSLLLVAISTIYSIWNAPR